jgi:hypothetical protein
MKTKILLIVFFSLFYIKVNAQINIEASKVWGGSQAEYFPYSQKVGNVIHVVGQTNSTNYPVTNATTTGGDGDVFYTQINATTGGIILSTVIAASSSSDYPVSMVVDGGSVYILGTTYSNNFPVTNGSIAGDNWQPMFYMKLSTTDGSIQFASYLGGLSDIGGEEPHTLLVQGDTVHILANTYSDDFPVTNSSTYTPGAFQESDLTYTQINANTGDIIFATYLGGSREDAPRGLYIQGNKVYILGSTYSTDFPVTNSKTNAGGYDITLSILEANTGSLTFSTYLGGSGTESSGGAWYDYTIKNDNFFVENNRIHLIGFTQSGDFPVTNGSSFGNGSHDAFYTQINATTGEINFSTYIGGNGYDYLYAVRVENNQIHLLGNTQSTNYPVTDGSKNAGASSIGFYTQLNINTGAVIVSKYFSTRIPESKIKFENNIISSIGGISDLYPFPVTNSSSIAGLSDVLFSQINTTTGKVIGATSIGGTDHDNPWNFYLEGDKVQLIGLSRNASNKYPTTDASIAKGDNDIFYTVLKLCNTQFNSSNDTLSPSKQTVCQNGMAEKIIGKNIFLTGDSLPVIYKNGIAVQQHQQEGKYQWQNSSNATGPWFDIFGEVNKDYLPVVGSTTQYYRRLVFNSNGCLDTVSISNVDTIAVSGNSAPTLNGGGVFNTCPNISVTVGGSPTATGGSTPYTYSWIAGNNPTQLSTIANPTFSPAVSTIYTLTVVDSNLCKQISQAVVNVHTANAGIDVSACAGDSTRIKAVPVAGLSGTSYSWSPSGGLGCTSCPQPNSLVITSTTYTLTQTINKSGGGTCATTDEVDVVPISAPSTIDFAGVDKVICFGSSDTLGTPANFVSMPYTVAQSTTDTYTGNYSNLTDANFSNGVRTLQYNYLAISAVYQTSINGHTGTVANLDDSDFGTGARTNTGIDQWIMVDLGSPKYIGGVRLSAITASNLNGRTIEASVDSVTWNSINQGSNLASMSNSALVNVTRAVTYCRYIRVKTRTSGQAVDLSELKILEAQWVSIDLGKNYENIVKVEASAITTANLTGSDIQTSSDNVNWTSRLNNLGSVSNSSLVAYTLFNNPSTRYLRFIRKSDAPLDLSELKVYQTFSYTWASGNYLSSNSTSLTIYNPGNLTFPTNPDSATYYLTASRQGCSFTDAVNVSVIRAYAGVDGCGPRDIGGNTDVLTLNENFAWSIVSGTGSITGSTNTPITSVSASPTGNPTTYRLTTTYRGQTCTDDVYVPDCACGVEVNVAATFGCPNFNFGAVQLTANPLSGNSSDYDFVWTVDSGQVGGLNAFNTNIVNLTDNLSRKFKVTITNKIDNSFTCFVIISVNQPNMNLPIFVAKDTAICAGQSIAIGQASVAGYSYAWTPFATLSSSNTSNPNANPTVSTEYKVKVTDVGSGCFTNDTASIIVRSPIANAGNDGIVCNSSAIFPLGGESARANHSYSWSPSGANWQSGTSSTSAQPLVLVAVNTTFTLTATDTITGCQITDMVDIVVNNSPTAGNAPDILICKNIGDTIGLPQVPGATYSWSPTSGLSCTTCPMPIANPSTTTTYTNTITYPGGCTSSDAVDVTVQDPSFTLSDINFCTSGGAFAIGGGAPGGMSTYNWMPASLVSSPTTASTNTLNPPPSTTTTFTLSVTDAFGCSASDALDVIPSLAAPIAGSDKSICLNDVSTQIGSASNPTGGSLSYSWSPATGLSSATSPNPTFTPSAAGIYTFELTKTDGSIPCSNKSSVTIVVNDFTLPTIAQPTICQGSSIQIGTTPVGGVSYYWTPSSNLSSTTIANPIASPTASTAYNLIAIGANGCSASSNVSVTVSSSPAPTITIPTIIGCISQLSDTFRPLVTPAGSYIYTWTPNNGLLSDVNSLNPKVNFGFIGTTVYTLTATNTSNGCSNSANGSVIVESCLFISGNIYNDTTGNADNDVDGTAIDAPSSAPLWAYLSLAGTVVDSAKVNSNGKFNFHNAKAYTNYSIRISTTQTGIGTPIPSATLPTNWVNTGEEFGNGNSAGIGLESSLADGTISVSTGFVNLSSIDFGIEVLPNSDNKSYTLNPEPNFNDVRDLTESGKMGILTGSDAEDGNYGQGAKFKIKDISGLNGNILFYDLDNDGILDSGEELIAGSIIENYDSSKLSVKFDGLNSTSFVFTYASIDAAGLEDPTPATYSVNWSTPLPVTLLYLNGQWQGNDALIRWATATEINNSHFVLERSLDGINYSYLKTINSKAINGNSNSIIDYSFVDNSIQVVINKNVFYKLTQFDNDGKNSSYAPVVLSINKGNSIKITEYPNPTNHFINIDFENLEDEFVSIVLVDVLGKIQMNKAIDVNSSFFKEQLDISNLANGIYKLEVKTTTSNYNFSILKTN